MRSVTIPDAHLSPLWWGQLPGRVADKPWTADFHILPLDQLYCHYPTPGNHDTPPGGIMGAVGWLPDSSRDRRIVEMAAAISAAQASGALDTTGLAIQRVLSFVAGGTKRVCSATQPMAWTRCNGKWYVFEGTHRAIALAMMQVLEWEAIDFSSLRQ